jgi:hypothetical protein
VPAGGGAKRFAQGQENVTECEQLKELLEKAWDGCCFSALYNKKTTFPRCYLIIVLYLIQN